MFAVSQFSEPNVEYCDGGKQPGQRPTVYLPLRVIICILFFSLLLFYIALSIAIYVTFLKAIRDTKQQPAIVITVVEKATMTDQNRK